MYNYCVIRHNKTQQDTELSTMYIQWTYEIITIFFTGLNTSEKFTMHNEITTHTLLRNTNICTHIKYVYVKLRNLSNLYPHPTIDRLYPSHDTRRVYIHYIVCIHDTCESNNKNSVNRYQSPPDQHMQTYSNPVCPQARHTHTYTQQTHTVLTND